MEDIELERKLFSLIENNFGFDYKIIQNNKKENLFFFPFFLDYIQMVYLYVLIIDHFNISISGDDLINNQFITVENICKLIKNKLL